MSQTENQTFTSGTQRIAATLGDWRRQLLDTSRISKLINCKFSRGSGGVSAGGALLLEHPIAELLWDAVAVRDAPVSFAWVSELLQGNHGATDEAESADQTEEEESPKPNRVNLNAEELESCLRSRNLNPDNLVTGLFDKRLDKTLKRLSLAAQTSLSEQGVNSLFLAFGFVRWFESADSDVETISPLLLVPVTLSKEHGESTWVVKPVDDDIVVNHSLAELFRSDFRIALPEAEDNDLRTARETFSHYLNAVRDAIAGQNRWTVEAKTALGLFGFQKISMWHDLRRNENQIADHPLCRSIAGDSDSTAPGEGDGAADTVPPITAAQVLDASDVSPGEHNLILDCDGSQLAAIASVKGGSHLILDGPPGTGKSQTIANIIAETLAAGKTVLFVSEKPAALEVVKRRLDRNKLGDFCLECHSHKSNKRAVIMELGRCLNHQPERYPAQDDKLSELDRCRQVLNRYVRALHTKQSALEISAYQMHGKLAVLLDAPLTRVDVPDPHGVNKIRLQQLEEAVARLVRAEGIIAARGEHPWRGCRSEIISLSFVDDVRHHFPRAAEGLERRRLAAAPLNKLGLLVQTFSAKQLALARQNGKATARFPFVPVAWVARGLRESADAYIQLDDLASSFRIAMSAAEAFDRKVLATASPETFESAERIAQELRTLLTALPSNIRGAHQHITQVRELLGAATQAADLLSAAGGALRELLGPVGTSDWSISEVRAWLIAGRVLNTIGRVPESWFDSARRARLKKGLVEAQQAGELAVLARKPLENRFRPIATAPASSTLADELLAHSSWLKRLGGSWRRAKLAFIALYIAATPKRAQDLLDDAHLLNRYRAAEKSLATAAAAADPDTFGWDGSIDFDWKAAAARLQQFDDISPSIVQLPEFQSIATKADPAVTLRLRTSLGEVERCLGGFDSASAPLLKAAQSSSLIGTERIDDCGLATLRTSLNKLDSQLAEAQVTIATLISWLSRDGDTSIEQLRNDLDAITTIRTLHRDAESTASLVGEQIPPMDQGSLGDYSKHAAIAKWVRQFIDQFSGRPPEALVRLLTDRTARGELVNCLKEIEETETVELRDSLKFIGGAFPTDTVISNGIVLDQISEMERIAWLNDRARDAQRVEEWGNYLFACAELDRCGLSVLRDEVLLGTIQPHDALAAFKARFYKRWLDDAYSNEPLLREFDPGVHDHTAQRFRELDRYWIHNGFARIRSELIAKCPNPSRLGGVAPGTSEIGVLLRETNKKRRHLPLRKLFAAMPTLLQRLKPCLMMSPLAVSTYLDTCEAQFDLVIFDEASQVRPHDAICAIYRGKQLVVAGDQKQLPPTNFFEKLTSEEAEEADEEVQTTNDFESILDVCASLGLPRQRLKWHYRSKRESLIAFSNKYFYDGELITFPSVLDVDGSSGVTLNFIAEGLRGKRGSVTNALEATKIAQAVVNHAIRQADKSLGVITMNVQQQMLVLEEISRLRRNDSNSETFFALDNPEPFFVKNLENVQGDERDFIFMGIGFAKDETGNLSHSFGPLNRSGGERRLNVAVTRARESLTIFSSIKAQDIDLSRTAAAGARLLRAYLDFAERGQIALTGETSESAGADNDSEFEAQVERALRSHGLDVRRQVGCCGFRIDLALVDPAHKGRYVLGIEADGATYHSSASARDRDRLRQELLESLGWRITRIWSTDWIRNPQRQIERVLKAYEAALAAAEVADTAVPTPSTVETLTPTSPPVSHSAGRGDEQQRRYNTIDDVPAELVEKAFCESLKAFGSTSMDDLLQHVARSLGFQRVGARIRERLGQSLSELSRIGKVQVTDDRVVLAPTSDA